MSAALDLTTATATADLSTAPGRLSLWSGRACSGLAVAFLVLDGGMKLLQLAPAVEATAALGYPAEVVLPLGVVQAACLALYLLPRTSVLGAILWTGYLGGAVASHVRLGNPMLSHTLFPVYLAALLWLGLWLREPRLRSLLSLR